MDTAQNEMSDSESSDIPPDQQARPVRKEDAASPLK